MLTTSRPLFIRVIPGVKKRQGRIGPNAGRLIARELGEIGCPGHRITVLHAHGEMTLLGY